MVAWSGELAIRSEKVEEAYEVWVMDLPFRRTLKSPGIVAVLWEEADGAKALNEYRDVFSWRRR